MSDEKKELSVVDQLKEDMNKFVQQRDAHHANLNQVIGAIYATEQAIKKLDEKELTHD